MNQKEKSIELRSPARTYLLSLEALHDTKLKKLETAYKDSHKNDRLTIRKQ